MTADFEAGVKNELDNTIRAEWAEHRRLLNEGFQDRDVIAVGHMAIIDARLDIYGAGLPRRDLSDAEMCARGYTRFCTAPIPAEQITDEFESIKFHEAA